MPKLTTPAGLSLAYEVQGDGPPVVMIMGLGAQLVLWPQELVDAIAAAGFRTIRFDNRDIGQSSWFDHLGVPNNAKLLARRLAGLSVAAPYDLSAMASDAVGLLDTLGIARAHLIGASLGGMIAQTVAIEHPERIASLTSIMSSAGNLSAFAVHPRALKQMLGKPPKNREEYVDRIVTLFRGHAGTHPYDAERMAELAGQQYDRGYHPQGFARQFAAILASGSRLERLKSVTAPTLVVHGTHDPLVPLRAGRMVADAIPGASFLPIDGMGHELPRPIWQQLTDAVTAHMGKAGRAA